MYVHGRMARCVHEVKHVCTLSYLCACQYTPACVHAYVHCMHVCSVHGAFMCSSASDLVICLYTNMLTLAYLKPPETHHCYISHHIRAQVTCWWYGLYHTLKHCVNIKRTQIRIITACHHTATCTNIYAQDDAHCTQTFQ